MLKFSTLDKAKNHHFFVREIQTTTGIRIQFFIIQRTQTFIVWVF